MSSKQAGGRRLMTVAITLSGFVAKKEQLGELGEVVSEALKGQEVRFMRCSQSTGDLFPLPLPSSLERATKIPPCVDALVLALNSLYGTKTII